MKRNLELATMLAMRPKPGQLRKWLTDYRRARAEWRSAGKPWNFTEWWVAYHVG